MSGNLSSYHFLLPGRRGKGPGRQPPGKITGVRSALLPPDPCQYHRWPREGQRGRGGNTRPSSANYNPSLRGLSFRVCSAISGKEKKKKKRHGASRDRGRFCTYCESLPVSEIAERAGEPRACCVLVSGNCRAGSDRHSVCFGKFRKLPKGVE